MSVAVYVNPIEVDNRLEELGWSCDDFLEVAAAMASGRNSCTEKDPTSAPGWMAWKEGTRRLREIGRPRGLEKDDTDQIPAVTDLKRRLKFLVSNTDDATGNPARMPQNRNRKGPGTDRLVETNQGLLFTEEEIEVVRLPTAPIPQYGLTTWYLCVYSDGDVMRAELSCPVDVQDGLFTDFYERIILTGPDGGPGAAVRRREDEGDDSGFDIPVSRK